MKQEPSRSDVEVEAACRDEPESAVAIIGISCRFPGASDALAFWDMLERGKDGLVSQSSEGDIRRSCFSMPERFAFDAAFFGITPAQAKVMDPQHRVFLECAWHALEDAGYGNRETDQNTGLFAACGFNDYVLRHLGPRDFSDSAAETFDLILGNDKDYLAARTAHLLNLTGPVMVCQSACSSGLLCVHQAVQSLLQHETHMVLAGAASVSVSLEDGYSPDPGGVMSERGQIAPFDSEADGIVGGNGAAVVVMKRLSEALADDDYIYAVVRGSAANNDGAMRASFTAPSAEGQRRVLQEALSLSGLEANDITYIEAHGTGTPLGDPIEMGAIHEVYGDGSKVAMVGSVKGNTGHLNAAAGLAGLIKTIGVLIRQSVPETRHLKNANAALELEGTRFVLRPSEFEEVRIDAAAVSSFGFGGTNVHLVLQRAPERHRPVRNTQSCVLQMSAREVDALQASEAKLAAALRNSQYDLADVACSLADGRSVFAVRSAVIARDTTQAVDHLTTGEVLRPSGKADPVFVFPGQGTQFPGMGQVLYETIPAIRQSVDAIVDHAVAMGCEDLRPDLFGCDEAALRRTDKTQLSLFSVEYAIGQWLLSSGVTPKALLGHSVGEIAAAALAGVFSWEDATGLIVERGRLIADLPEAGMLLVRASENQVREMLPDEADIAVVNAPDAVAISAEKPVLDGIARLATERGWQSHRLPVSHGFHSRLVVPALNAFRATLEGMVLSPPGVALFSNVTGDLARPEDLVTPDYWVRHMRETVRFGDNVATARTRFPNASMLIVGPGAISGMSSMMIGRETQAQDTATALGQLWVEGCTVDKALSDLRGTTGRHVPLPGYPFARTEHIAPPDVASKQTRPEVAVYRTQWTRLPKTSEPVRSGKILWFGDDCSNDPDVLNIRVSDRFEQVSDREWHIRRFEDADIEKVIRHEAVGGVSQIVVACFGADAEDACWLLETLKNKAPVLTVLTRSLASIVADEAHDPKQAVAQGWLQNLAMTGMSAKPACLDVDATPSVATLDRLAAIRMAAKEEQCLFTASRNGHIWTRTFTSAALPVATKTQVLQRDGTYLIVGGLGALGRALLDEIADSVAQVILISRTVDAEVVADPECDPHLKGLIAEGLAMQVLRADVSDLASLHGLSEMLISRGARVSGVFNLAGSYGFEQHGPTTVRDGKNYQAKVVGSENIAAAFADHNPDFIAIFASMAGETSGTCIADYVTASLTAAKLAETSPAPIRTIAWDTWDRVGNATDLSSVAGAVTDGQVLISAKTGFRKMWSILAAKLSYSVVSSLPIEARKAAVASAISATRMNDNSTQDDVKQSPVVHMAQLLFSEILGVETVQPSDDFLAIGGDSISAVRLVSRLRKLFGVEMELARFMSSRTPLALAALLGDAPDLMRRAETFARFQTMPEDQRKALRRSLQPA